MGGVGIGRKLNALLEVFLVYIVLIEAYALFESSRPGRWIELVCIVLLFVILVSLALVRKDFSRYGISRMNSDGEIKAIVVFATSMFFLVLGSIWSVCVLLLLSVARRDFSRYGITLRGLGSDLKIAAICIIPVMAVDISVVFYKFGNLGGTLLYSALILLALFVILIVIRKMPYKENTFALRARTIVPAVAAGAIISLGSIVSMIGEYHAVGAPGLLLELTDALVFGFVLQAIPQQLLFNGYIQSRLNEAFGRPYKLLGIEWGAGLMITALLFGLMHVIYHQTILWGIWTFCFWLIYGFIREKTSNITASTMIHGIEDTFSYIVYF